MLCQFVTTVLSPDDNAAISQIVATTIHGLQAGRDGGGGNRQKCHVDEKFFRKISTFAGENWRDWSFQVKAAAKSSSKEAGKLLDWAEEQLDEILDYSALLEDADRAEKMSGELFQILTQLAAEEPLQVLHNCAYNGVEAWRRFVKRCAPSTPLRAMQLLLGILNPEKPKSNKEIPNMIDRWEHRVMVLERDFKESMSSRMRSAILISTGLLTSGILCFRAPTNMRSISRRRSLSSPWWRPSSRWRRRQVLSRWIVGELEDQQTTAASTQQAAAETRAIATGAVSVVTLPETAPKELRVVIGKDSVERVGSAGRQGIQ